MYTKRYEDTLKTQEILKLLKEKTRRKVGLYKNDAINMPIFF